MRTALFGLLTLTLVSLSGGTPVAAAPGLITGTPAPDTLVTVGHGHRHGGHGMRGRGHGHGHGHGHHRRRHHHH